ncbi:MAG: type IV toxin-antitoxin system AbiEi family antitoxin domain-containing protein [Friedmanniella sp.]
MEIRLTAQLLGEGFSADELHRLRRSGQLDRVRRGAYAPPAGDSTPEEAHRRLVAAVLTQRSTETVASHISAAVLHGLPVWRQSLGAVHLTRPRTGGGRVRGGCVLHTSPLRPADVVTLDGLRVTSLARTVADLARTLPLDQAVAAGDAALRRGLPVPEVLAVLERCRGWPGVGQARRTAGLLDARSESVGESCSRVRMHEAGLPVPVPQYEVYDGRGQLVGRADFGWEEQRVLGEFDGRVKYGRLLRPGQTVEEVVYREKLREDALRDLGWRVVRWTWADVFPGHVLVSRLSRAFGLGSSTRHL